MSYILENKAIFFSRKHLRLDLILVGFAMYQAKPTKINQKPYNN
jgi:hypothetical protein